MATEMDVGVTRSSRIMVASLGQSTGRPRRGSERSVTKDTPPNMPACRNSATVSGGETDHMAAMAMPDSSNGLTLK
jgi:hypothetical protein